MELTLRRFVTKPKSTGGVMHVDGDFFNFTLENGEQLPGESTEDKRIPAGRYQVMLKEDPTPLTMKYREKYDFFKWHLEVQNVPGRKNIYIHVGNTEKHTLGCILVAWIFDATVSDHEVEDTQGASVPAYKRLYLKVKSALERGEKVYITVLDK